MYFPYEETFRILSFFLPKNFQQKFLDYGMRLKLQQNLDYIDKNKVSVLNRLKEKLKNNVKINVVFYIYDETKWKSQSLYDYLENSEEFIPYIFVTKNCAPKSNFNYQTEADIEKCFHFFKNKKMRVEYAYNIKKEKHIAFDKMKIRPDVIIYSHPWYVYKTQGPVIASKYALTYYIPYFLPTSVSPTEYYLRFHQYVENFCVLNETIAKEYSKKMANGGKNLKVLGHPQLDYFYINKDKFYENENYVIYAPHWTIDDNNNLKWGTFKWSGDFILDFAQKHPEYNWIFKPHPCLKAYLKTSGYMSETKIQEYWNTWEKIGKIVEDGDYLDLFMKSNAMITDCGSFLTEFFMTNKPLIHLQNKNSEIFNKTVCKISDNYYNVYDEKELKKSLKDLLIDKNDYKKELRKIYLKDFKSEISFSASKIVNDIKNCINQR